MNRIITGVMAAALLATPAWAHHAFSAEFDINRPIRLNGVVTEVEFVNPHAWLHVAVRGGNGGADEWLIETGSPNRLRGRGITKLSMAPRTQVLVDGYAAKDGSRKGSAQELTLPDGRRLFISGTRPADEAFTPLYTSRRTGPVDRCVPWL